MRILIADDHAVVRRGLREILSAELSPLEIGEAADAAETLQSIRRDHWDAVVLDITMPGGGGMDVLKQIRSSHPSLPVIVLSMHPEDQYALRALRAGAAGYVTKDAAPEELVAAIRKALSGGKYVSDSLAQRLAAGVAAGLDGPSHSALSDREYEVMCMLAGGTSVSGIAIELSLSVKTVSTYRSRILSKMGMASNAELTRYAMTEGLL
ncbi:hypothetical protein LCGC14_1633480 [marine sediment metagenome]|uniref:Response regulatory domain-containing protein n=1 Tax=marine sediment metagenome TaxID=412755 RepID=A0A0F9L1L0_9ZZZZ